MTIGQVIELLKGIFEMLTKYLGDIFNKGGDAEGEDTEVIE